MRTLYSKRKPLRSSGSPRRHTHRTAAGIEDALAVLLDTQQELEILRLRLDRALTILRDVRAGPHAYDPEKPAGLRLRIKTR
jgi:hypothetical protein